MSDNAVLPPHHQVFQEIQYEEHILERPRRESIYYEGRGIFTGKSVLRPEYGTLFRAQGFIQPGLDRQYLYTVIQLPSEADLAYQIPKQTVDCSKLTRINELMEGLPTEFNTIHIDLCATLARINSDLTGRLQEKSWVIRKKIRTSLAAILPNKIYQDAESAAVQTLDGRYIYKEIGNKTTTILDKLPAHLSTGIFDRVKRMIGTAISIIGMIGGLIFKGINTFINYKVNY